MSDSKSIESIKNGIAVALSFIGISVFVYLTPGYFTFGIISKVESVIFGIIGVGGLGIELNKLGSKGKNIGFDNLGFGLAFGALGHKEAMYMSKKVKILLISIIGLLLVLVLTAFIFLMGIRGEFTKHLEEKYSDLSFRIGFTKIDPIYEKFYAKVTCLNDETSFPISKSFKTNDIHEDYPQYKNRIQYNSKIKSIFDGSNIEGYIKSVTGGGKIPFENDGVYTQINIHLIDDVELPIVKKVLYVLKDNNISAERIILTYEKDKHVYEIWLSSNDYALNEKEIEAKAKKIK